MTLNTTTSNAAANLAAPITGTAGNDTLFGGADDDTLNGLAGDDTLDGGLGNDVYLFTFHDGRDTIVSPANSAASERDVLHMNLLPADVTISSAGLSLLVTIRDGYGQMLVENFIGMDNEPNPDNPLREIRFADLTTWTVDDIMRQRLLGSNDDDSLTGNSNANLLTGRYGDDWLSGGDGKDTLDGGPGKDSIVGGLGNDTYLFGKDGGQDTVYPTSHAIGTSAPPDTADTLQFKEGVRADEVRISIDGAALVVSINNTWNQVRFEGYYSEGILSPNRPLHQIRFTGGPTWNAATIDFVIYRGSESGDILQGDSNANKITGLGGADQLSGNGGNDTLDGGIGNDTLDGGSGNDVYLIGSREGSDSIASSFDARPDRLDTLAFKSDVRPENISMGTSGEALIITTGGGNQVQVNSFLVGDDPANPLNPLQQIRFSDGKIWGMAGILAKLFGGTSGSDMINGTRGADTIGGGAGNDFLDGKAGDDTFDGGAGNDLLSGGLGNDTYVVDRGDGKDLLTNGIIKELPGSINTLEFRLGVVPGDLKLGRIGDNLLITVLGSNDEIEVDDFVAGNDTANPSNPLQQIRFAGGATWNLAEITARMFTGTSGADITTGTIGADKIGGLAGDDRLNGIEGNDILDGGAGNDSLYGGSGDDQLTGGAGSDTYLFGKGHGHDFIMSSVDSTAGKLDTLLFWSGVAGSELQLSAVGSTLNIQIAGSADQITAYNVLPQNNVPNAASPLQQIKFADGVVWDMARIQAELLADSTPAPAAPSAATTAPEVVPGIVGMDTGVAQLAW